MPRRGWTVEMSAMVTGSRIAAAIAVRPVVILSAYMKTVMVTAIHQVSVSVIHIKFSYFIGLWDYRSGIGLYSNTNLL